MRGPLTRAVKAAIRDRAIRDYGVLDRTPLEYLRFVTIVAHAAVCSRPDDPALVETVAQKAQAFADLFKATLRATGTCGRGATRWAGVLEVDLVHPRMAGGAHKQRLFVDVFGLQSEDVDQKDRIAVLHLHAVIDVRGHGIEMLDKVLRETWPGARRVELRRLHADKSVEGNLKRLAEYSTKYRYRYAEAWLGRRTKYYMPVEKEWQQALDNMYGHIGDLIVANVVSRARPECRREARKTQRFQGVSSPVGGHQLINAEEDTGTEGNASSDSGRLQENDATLNVQSLIDGHEHAGDEALHRQAEPFFVRAGPAGNHAEHAPAHMIRQPQLLDTCHSLDAAIHVDDEPRPPVLTGYDAGIGGQGEWQDVRDAPAYHPRQRQHVERVIIEDADSVRRRNDGGGGVPGDKVSGVDHAGIYGSRGQAPPPYDK